MYPAIKSNAMTEDRARAIFGNLAVDTVLSLNCDFTGRVIDDCFNVYEFSASCNIEKIRLPENEEERLTVLYLESIDDVDNCNDLGDLKWDCYTFVAD